MKLLIDGDIIVYSAGFSSDQRIYRVNGQSFKYKADANTYCEENSIDLKNISKEIYPEPLQHCLGNVKKLINSILDVLEHDDYQIYLTGDGNFREEAATRFPYKGNRDPNHKPFYYKEIKDYLINVWKADVIHGMEADDAMGIEQYSTLYKSDISSEGWCDTTICTKDKDLNMIPGWHYNWQTKEHYWITEEEGIRHFYKQLLAGDNTDNIKGIPRVGMKTAEKLLSNCSTEREMYDKVLYEYGLVFTEEDVEKIVHENARLLWIWRKDDDFWTPPENKV